MRRIFLAFTLLAPLAVLAGCGDDAPPTTDDFATNELSMYTSISSNGYLAQAAVSILGEGATLELGPGDSLLFAENGGPEQHLVFAQGGYYGQIETSGTAFEITFVRGTNRTTNPLSIPPAFELAGPNSSVSRLSPIPITWGPPGSGFFETWLEISGDCLSYPVTRYFSSDVGTYETQPADLAIKPGTVNCDLHAWVTRSTSANTGIPGFGAAVTPGGNQVRAISIPTTP